MQLTSDLFFNFYCKKLKNKYTRYFIYIHIFTLLISMTTILVSKLINYGIRTNRIKRVLAVSTVEKLISMATRLIIYPTLLNIDLFALSAVPLIISVMASSITQIAPIDSGILVCTSIVGSSVIYGLLQPFVYVTVVAWIFYNYWRNTLYVWQI